MNKIKFISLAVAVVAMVFNFSCSSDDGENEVGGSSSSVGNDGDLSSSSGNAGQSSSSSSSVTAQTAALEGTWEASDGRTFIFTGNTWEYKANGTIWYSGTFSVSGSTITLDFIYNRFDNYYGPKSVNFQLSEETFIFLAGDRDATGTYTKTSGGGGSSSSVGGVGSSSSGGGLATPTKTTFVDDRDNKTYKKVKIGTQTWMAENLNYAGEAGNEIGRCYDNDPANCTEYGRLYDWSMAMNGAASSTATPSGVRGVCPDGWHLPSDAEWTTLTDYVGGDDIAGKILKSTTGWSIGPGTDDYGFSALPGGGGFADDGRFAFVADGISGIWWSATEIVSYSAWRCNMGRDSNVNRGYNNKSGLFSVRCVQDN